VPLLFCGEPLVRWGVVSPVRQRRTAGWTITGPTDGTLAAPPSRCVQADAARRGPDGDDAHAATTLAGHDAVQEMAATYSAELSVGSNDSRGLCQRTVGLIELVGAHVDRARWDVIWRIEVRIATSGATTSNETFASPDELTARLTGETEADVVALSAVVSHDGLRHADAPMVAVDLRCAPSGQNPGQNLATTCYIRTMSDAEARGLADVALATLQSSRTTGPPSS
jgi:hypothetical protein